jgi:hypothetical protein
MGGGQWMAGDGGWLLITGRPGIMHGYKVASGRGLGKGSAGWNAGSDPPGCKARKADARGILGYLLGGSKEGCHIQSQGCCTLGLDSDGTSHHRFDECRCCRSGRLPPGNPRQPGRPAHSLGCPLPPARWYRRCRQHPHRQGVAGHRTGEADARGIFTGFRCCPAAGLVGIHRVDIAWFKPGGGTGDFPGLVFHDQADRRLQDIAGSSASGSRPRTCGHRSRPRC